MRTISIICIAMRARAPGTFKGRPRARRYWARWPALEVEMILSSSDIRSSRGEVGVDGRGDGWGIAMVNDAA